MSIKGVNIPLQQRGAVLDLDSNRTDAPVIDYDVADEKSIDNTVDSNYQQKLVSSYVSFFILNWLSSYLVGDYHKTM